jgi:hypothetical protein
MYLANFSSQGCIQTWTLTQVTVIVLTMRLVVQRTQKREGSLRSESEGLPVLRLRGKGRREGRGGEHPSATWEQTGPFSPASGVCAWTLYLAHSGCGCRSLPEGSEMQNSPTMVHTPPWVLAGLQNQTDRGRCHLPHSPVQPCNLEEAISPPWDSDSSV